MLLQVCYVLFFTVALINGQSSLGLKQGDVCKEQGKTVWKCEFLFNCPQIGDFKNNRPNICKFEGIDPIICCPPPSQNTSNNNNNNNSNNNTDQNPVIASKRSAQEVCNNYIIKECTTSYTGPQLVSLSNHTIKTLKSSRRNDGIASTSEGLKEHPEVVTGIETRIVGGEPSEPKAHKYMVLIGYGSVDKKRWNCGGSLLSERWVLSAAHCARTISLGPARWARVGDLDISTTDDDARPQDKFIVERVIHPNYKEPAAYNDVALFKLDSSVVFNSWVGPICLHTKEEINVPKATIIGWGRLEFAGGVSVELQEVQATIVNGTDCRRAYYNDTGRKIPRGIDTQSMICAGEKEGGKSACTGDSGGPVLIDVPDNCLKSQIGVISFGRDCALPDTPSVFSKVSHFVPWIESIVWPQ